MVRRRLTELAHIALDFGEVISTLVPWPSTRVAINGERAVIGGDAEPKTNGHELPAVEPPRVVEQWGLRLPDGNVVWGNYKGNALQTLPQREALVDVLRRTAADLNFEENAFLSHYGWGHRLGTPAIRWGDIAVYPLTIQEEQASDTPELSGDLGVSDAVTPDR